MANTRKYGYFKPVKRPVNPGRWKNRKGVPNGRSKKSG